MSICAAGPNGNGLYAETNVINYDIDAQFQGYFPGVMAFPYVPAAGTNNYIALEAQTYLQLAPGFYTFAVRSDDGFKFTAGMTPTDTNLVLGIFDGGRGNTVPSVFSFSISQAGLYPMRLLYFQSQFGGNVSLYSLNRANGNAPVLINDPVNPDAIRAFQPGSGALPVTLLNPTDSAPHTFKFQFLAQSGHTNFVEYKNTW